MPLWKLYSGHYLTFMDETRLFVEGDKSTQRVLDTHKMEVQIPRIRLKLTFKSPGPKLFLPLLTMH